MADNPSFSLTRNQIIIDALQIVGASEVGEQPSADEFSVAGRRLNALINEIAPFIEVFSLEDKEHTLTAGTESYTVKNGGDIDMYRPYDLVYARRKNSSTGDEIPIFIESRREYMDLPNKSTQAPPNIVYYHPGVSQGTLYVWPTGDSTWDTLVLTFKTPRNTMDSTGSTLDFPQEWHDAITWMLAEAIAPVYLGTIPQWLYLKAKEKRDLMEANDVGGGSIYFQPENRRR